MNKTELENAIKNGESVWCICWNNIYEIKATNIQKINKGEIEYFDKTKDFYLEVNLLDIYKTKVEAEHYSHHANITRTEQLPFLTWEEFLEKKAIHFIDNKGIDFVLCITENKIKLMVFFMISKTWNLTEENFYKAYDECVRLFKEEV